MSRSRSGCRWGPTSLALGAVLIASCATDDTGSPSGSAPTSVRPPTIVTASSTSSTELLRPELDVAVPSDVEMFFDYPRYLWHTRRLSVATTNLGDAPISITSIAVRADHFTELAPEAKRTVIAPGQRVDVQVDFGELTSCSPSGDERAAVEVEMRHGDATPVSYLIELDDAPLDEIRDRECGQQRVETAAAIRFADDRTIDGSTMRTSIEVVRRDGTPTIEISSLRGSVIFALVPDDDSEPLAVLSAEIRRAAIPIVIEVSRCDPHVVSQSSRTFDLAAYVSVDGAAAHRHQLDVDRRLQGELQSMIDHCAASDT